MNVQTLKTTLSESSSTSSSDPQHSARTERAKSVVSNTTASTNVGQNEVLQSMNALVASVGSWIADTNSIPPFHQFELDVEARDPQDLIQTSFSEAEASTITDQAHTSQLLETNFASVGIWFTGTSAAMTVEDPGVTSERETPVPTIASTPNTTSLGAFVQDRSFTPPADHFDLDLEAQNPLPQSHTSLLCSIRGRYVRFHKRFEHPVTIGGTVITLVIFTLGASE